MLFQTVIRENLQRLFPTFWQYTEQDLLFTYIELLSKQRWYGYTVMDADLPPRK